jgi:type III pantothenate kinase
MQLLIDVGNSYLKWVLLETSGLLTLQQRIFHQVNQLEVVLSQAWLTIKPQAVWIANVAGPQKAAVLTRWCESNWQLQPQFVKTARTQCGVINGYQQAEQLGVDRWLALIGAHHLVEAGQKCIIDCGTAITVDMLTTTGNHLGGLILPGIITMYKSLKQDTHALAQQPFSNSEVLKTLLATNTQQGMTSGILHAVIGLLEHLGNNFKVDNYSPQLILTGGDAPILIPYLTMPYKHIPDLVLQGLAQLVKQSL